jgi:siderophore synthetase component
MGDAIADALPGARAAVLARLWGGLHREPIEGVAGRAVHNARLTIRLADGRALTGDAAAAAPFAEPPVPFIVVLDGCPYADPGALLRALALPSRTARYARELDDSVANLALARAVQPPPDGGAPALTRPLPHPAYWEQLVVDGHPLHPGCRTRLGLTTEEVRRYAPEHRARVDLVEVAVPPDRWLTTGAGLPPVLTMHPWQADHLLDAHPALRRTGRRRPARPLMSLRTLAPLDDRAVHLKTAVDVQMTGAVRTVSPAAVRNGPVVTAFLADLARRVAPDLTVLREVAAGAVLVDGEPNRSLAVVHRQAPPDALPLAALAAPSPADGAPLAVEAVRIGYGGDPAAYLADLARLLLTGPLTLLQHGIGLEAHGQNTLVSLRGGRPHRLYYRDVGGVRLHGPTLRRRGIQPPLLHGDLAAADPDEPRTTLLAATGVVLGQQVAVLARATGTEPDRLWAAVTPRLPDPDVLPVKAFTAMRLAADPLTPRWTTLTGAR